MTDIKVAIAALRSDAKAWDEAADALDKPTGVVPGLTLNGGDDVTGLGERMGVHTTYHNVQIKMEQLLKEASEYFRELASTLLTVADDYEQRELHGTTEFKEKEGDLGGG